MPDPIPGFDPELIRMIRNAWIGVDGAIGSGPRAQEQQYVQYTERQLTEGQGEGWVRLWPNAVEEYGREQPMGEMVSAESREMLRDSDWLGKIMLELGLGSEVVDQTTDPDALLRLVYAKVKALKTLKDGPVRTETVYVPVPEPVGPASSAHIHNLQWKIMDLDDGVHEIGEWVSDFDGPHERERMMSHLSDYQLQGLDVRLVEYHRCNWVNLTTQKDWE